MGNNLTKTTPQPDVELHQQYQQRKLATHLEPEYEQSSSQNICNMIKLLHEPITHMAIL